MTESELEDLRKLILSGRGKLLRLCAGLTLAAAATEIGCAPRSVWLWETGIVPKASEPRARYYYWLSGLRDKLGDITIAERSKE